MRRALPILPLLLLAFGCSDLEQFQTPPGKAFEGVVVGTDDATGSFIRRGFPAGTILDLTFDPANATRVDPPPGTLTARAPSGDLILDKTHLVPSAPLAHDELSQYDFPGGGRVTNYIFYARPSSGPLAGRDPMVFVSLLQDGGAEVRIMGRTSDGCGNEGSAPCEFFGLWSLTLQPVM